MRYYYGENDRNVSLANDDFLKLNNCGCQENMTSFMLLREHGRRDWHLLYVHKGTPEIYYEGSEHTLHKGDFVIYAPYQTQKYVFNKGDITYYAHFDGTVCKELMTALGLSAGVYRQEVSLSFENEFREMLDMYSITHEETVLNGYIIRLLTIAGTTSTAENSTCGIMPALNYMNSHYNLELNIDNCAQLCGLSRSRFMHLFKEKTGKSPYKFMLEKRILRAKELLKHSQLRISEVSVETGFDDPLYFSRLFKRYTGCSPRQYRQQKS